MAMVVASSGAFAAPSGFGGVDGDWAEWFTYPGATFDVDWDQEGAAGALNPASGIRFANAPAGEFDHGAGLDALGDGTTPENGGQDYDVEQLFYYFEDYVPGSDTPANTTGGILHIGLVTGFPPGGTVDYLAGDFFIGFGSGAGYSVAVGVSGNAADAARLERLYDATSPAEYVDPLVNVAPTPWRTSGVDVTNTPDFGQVAVAWDLPGNTPWDRHYFLEIAVEISGNLEEQITAEIGGGVNLHWTMGCGNDYITVQDSDPFDPVPEPTTMVLLGMGVVGMALRARRPMC